MIRCGLYISGERFWPGDVIAHGWYWARARDISFNHGLWVNLFLCNVVSLIQQGNWNLLGYEEPNSQQYVNIAFKIPPTDAFGSKHSRTALKVILGRQLQCSGETCLVPVGKSLGSFCEVCWSILSRVGLGSLGHVIPWFNHNKAIGGDF